LAVDRSGHMPRHQSYFPFWHLAAINRRVGPQRHHANCALCLGLPTVLRGELGWPHRIRTNPQVAPTRPCYTRYRCCNSCDIRQSVAEVNRSRRGGTPAGDPRLPPPRPSDVHDASTLRPRRSSIIVSALDVVAGRIGPRGAAASVAGRRSRVRIPTLTTCSTAVSAARPPARSG